MSHELTCPLAMAVRNVRLGHRALGTGFVECALIHLEVAREYLGLAYYAVLVLDRRPHRRERVRLVQRLSDDLAVALIRQGTGHVAEGHA